MTQATQRVLHDVDLGTQALRTRELRAPRVLAMMPRDVGETVLATPALALIRRRWPAARICALAGSRRAAAVLRDNPHVDEVSLRLGRGRLLGGSGRVDVVVLLDARDRDVPGRTCAATVLRWETTACDGHRADALLDVAGRSLGVAVRSVDRRCVVVPSSADHRRAEALLATDEPLRTIGLHLASSRPPRTRLGRRPARSPEGERAWDPLRYGDLAIHLLAGDLRTRFVLTGSRADRALARRVRRETILGMMPTTLDLVGRTGLLELAALTARLDAFVCTDTGALHVAAAMRAPVVALFGPTDPHRVGPYPSRSDARVVRATDMADIQPASVASAVERLIRERSAIATRQRSTAPEPVARSMRLTGIPVPG